MLCTMLLLQAFQVSDQAVRLVRDGWFQPQEQPSGESKLRNPKVRGICGLSIASRHDGTPFASLLV